jgi:hypothetical protein
MRVTRLTLDKMICADSALDGRHDTEIDAYLRWALIWI